MTWPRWPCWHLCKVRTVLLVLGRHGMAGSSTLELLQTLQLLLLFSLRLDERSLICRSSSCFTVDQGTNLACHSLLVAGWSSPPPYRLYKLSDLLLFLLNLWSPVELWLTWSVSYRTFLSLINLGDLQPRPQHSCNLHYCFPFQGADQPSYGCRWFIPSLVVVSVGGCVCITLCDPGRGSCDFLVLPCVRVKRGDSVRHSTRRQHRLHSCAIASTPRIIEPSSDTVCHKAASQRRAA